MNDTVKNILIGGLSLGIGGVVGFFIAKKKYEHLADIECQSIIDSFKKNNLIFENEPKKKDEKVENRNEELISKKSYDAVVNDTIKNYNDYSRPYRTTADDDNVEMISSTDFNLPLDMTEGNIKAKETLVYYADDVLCDDDYNVVNRKSIIGNLDLKKLFIIDENDVIYISNKSMQKQYEIIYDERTFASINNKYKNLSTNYDSD